MSSFSRIGFAPVLAVLICLSTSISFAQDTKEAPAKQEETAAATADSDKATEDKEKAPEPITVIVADEQIMFTATGMWKSVPPRSRMLESELQIPRVGEDEQDGRLTIMGAGGTIEANIERWQGQFVQADGSETKEKTKQEKKQIAGQTVNLIDISGTFMDSPGGPFSGQAKIERENYRMLAAIIQTAEKGNYFVKLYGPKATIDKNAEHFKAMINSLKVVE